ncbi:Hexaprenyldihydroxybenzoate methyltransferase, mitochondrial-like protein [Gossypium australe]|uniref:Hexaprenyldihydroxybenzoate methyltransferase, mitochondrial-like protein n=1 Tax=Gossypium australe TaxID=47621 RepID=A0A5B6V494_9ROSI|nr:Hexaprenyldihydroxybenzoate methyltransferase, mitochondrial-like protein [Gossypium australe]
MLRSFRVKQKMIRLKLSIGSKIFNESLMRWPVPLMIISDTKLTSGGKRDQQWYRETTLIGTSSSLNLERNRKKKEFLELKYGNRSVVEYDRNFVYLSKYAHGIMPNEQEICIQFEDGLNEEIKMIIGGTEI